MISLKGKIREKPEGKEKSVVLKITTAHGTRRLRLRLKGKPMAAAYPSGYAASSGTGRDIYATILQAEGIRTGILSPIGGVPVAEGHAAAVQPSAMTALAGAASVTVKKEEKPPKPLTGIGIPEVSETVETAPAETTDMEQLRTVNIQYPLIPRQPKQGETVYAYANIFFDSKTNEMVYRVVEPVIDGSQKKLIENIKEYVQEKLDISFSQVKKKEAFNHLGQVLNRALKFYKVRDEKTKNIVNYYIFRDFIGLEKLEPLLNDSQIEDISCDGVGIPLFVYHRNPKFGSLRTNVIFENADELDMFVNRLSERCGKVISVAQPLLDAALPDGSRVQATLGSDIARHGSNFTIRMFTEKPLTPVDMIRLGTCDLRTLALFWFLIEHGTSVLVCGGTASGKTSLLNVLSLFIKPQMKIVSIEDTPELRLPHAHWVPEVARTPVAEAGKVDMFELLRESLRQRPDYIIVGEVRGKEAYVLFQQMAVGHSGMATLHADTFEKLLDRLTTAPIKLPTNLLQNIDLIVFIKRVKQDKRYKRRLSSITEVVEYDRDTKTLKRNEIFAWDPKSDKFIVKASSVILKKIADSTTMTEESIREDIRKRAKILQWMVDRNITDYKKTGDIFNLFYTAPEFLLQRIGNI